MNRPLGNTSSPSARLPKAARPPGVRRVKHAPTPLVKYVTLHPLRIPLLIYLPLFGNRRDPKEELAAETGTESQKEVTTPATVVDTSLEDARKEQEKRALAALRIQSAHRGHQGRRRCAALRSEKKEREAALAALRAKEAEMQRLQELELKRRQEELRAEQEAKALAVEQEKSLKIHEKENEEMKTEAETLGRP